MERRGLLYDKTPWSRSGSPDCRLPPPLLIKRSWTRSRTTPTLSSDGLIDHCRHASRLMIVCHASAVGGKLLLPIRAQACSVQWGKLCVLKRVLNRQAVAWMRTRDALSGGGPCNKCQRTNLDLLTNPDPNMIHAASHASDRSHCCLDGQPSAHTQTQRVVSLILCCTQKNVSLLAPPLYMIRPTPQVRGLRPGARSDLLLPGDHGHHLPGGPLPRACYAAAPPSSRSGGGRRGHEGFDRASAHTRKVCDVVVVVSVIQSSVSLSSSSSRREIISCVPTTA